MAATVEQLIIADVVVSVVVFMTTIPFFSNLYSVYSNSKDGKDNGVIRGVGVAIFIHLLIIFGLFFFIHTWDLIIGNSLPEYKLLGTNGIFSIFWAPCSLSGADSLANSLNAYRCLFFNLFVLVVSLSLGLFPALFFILALFITPQGRAGKTQTGDSFKKIFFAMLYTLIAVVLLNLYIESLNVVIQYKDSETIFDMFHAFWKQLLLV